MAKRARNASGRHAWVEMTRDDENAMIRAIQPGVNRVLEMLANRIAEKARASDAFQDSDKTTDPASMFGKERATRHRHLRQAIRVSRSRFPLGGYIVVASVPHAHLVEYGHMMVTHDGRTVGHVPAHAFLHPAKDAVAAALTGANGQRVYGEDI